jgi:dipeptidyl aminopeptidase/acylaminoacyl peptidase
MEEGTNWIGISSDGEMIAYKLSSGLWAIHADGTGKRLLVGTDRLQVVNPQAPGKKSLLDQFKWIPNTHRLLLNTTVDTEGQCCYIDNNDLYLVDADTLTIQTLLPPGKSDAIFDISPDGKRVALVSKGGIDLLNLHTREKYNLIQYEPVMVPSEVGGYLKPLWSSDSQYLMVVVSPPDFHYGTLLPSKIWKLPVNRKSPQLVATIGPEFGLDTLSPDFLKIATQRQIGIGKDAQVVELHIANVDGSEDEIYQTGRLFFIGWSPDSTYFLYVNADGTYYLGQKGARPVEFPFPAYEYHLPWLDGQTFLYQKGPIEMREIRLGFLDGSSILLVGPTPINNYDFAR